MLATLLLICWPLAPLWGSDPQYHYGFVVPILAILLAIRRWATRPAPGNPVPGALMIAAICIFLFAPLWILLQPNPDWRLLDWLAAIVGCAGLVAATAVLGGRTWGLHFLFPIAFLLTALPWPARLEMEVTQGLMRGVAWLSAEILSLFGDPAISEGNLVHVSAGVLNVDLACSGIRSLQPALMMGLAMGEVFRLSLARRLILVAGAAVVAFLTNTGRVVVLGVVARRQGIEAIEGWHDPAGTVLVTICFVLVWILSLLLSRSFPLPPLTESSAPPARLPLGFGVAGVAWIACSLIGAELWFWRLEVPPKVSWTVTAPANARPIQIDANARAMLQYDEAKAWEWRDEARLDWSLHWLQWNPGPAHSRLLLNMHRPDVCLAAVGLRLIADRGTVQISSEKLSFHAYTFDSKQGRLHVYHSVYRNGTLLLETGESVRSACIKAVLERRRTVAQELIQIAIRGCETTAEADLALSREIDGLIHHK